MIFETERLIIRKPTHAPADIDLFLDLWNNPDVMVNVGFPRGLGLTREGVVNSIDPSERSEFQGKLVVIEKTSSRLIGECKLGWPNDSGVSETDVKLLPEFWGRGFGSELKQGLVDYLFTHTKATAVKATPNQSNIASQRMQEKVGGKRVGQGVYEFPPQMRAYTCDVPYFEYRVFREDWQKGRKGATGATRRPVKK